MLGRRDGDQAVAADVVGDVAQVGDAVLGDDDVDVAALGRHHVDAWDDVEITGRRWSTGRR